MKAMADDEEIRDELPDDLDASAYVGPYMFPNNNRRRIPGMLYMVIGAGAVLLWVLTRNSSPVLVNAGFLWGGIALILFGDLLVPGRLQPRLRRTRRARRRRPHGRFPRRARVRATRMARPAQPPDVAHPALLERRAAREARHRARRRRQGGRPPTLRGRQPRGLGGRHVGRCCTPAHHARTVGTYITDVLCRLSHDFRGWVDTEFGHLGFVSTEPPIFVG